MDKNLVGILFPFHVRLGSVADGIFCRVPCIDSTFIVMIAFKPPKIILTRPLGTTSKDRSDSYSQHHGTSLLAARDED